MPIFPEFWDDPPAPPAWVPLTVDVEIGSSWSDMVVAIRALKERSQRENVVAIRALKERSQRENVVLVLNTDHFGNKMKFVEPGDAAVP